MGKAIDVASIQADMEPWEQEVIGMVSKRPCSDLLLVTDRKGKMFVIHKSDVYRAQKTRQDIIDAVGIAVGVSGLVGLFLRVSSPFTIANVLFLMMFAGGVSVHRVRIWLYHWLESHGYGRNWV